MWYTFEHIMQVPFPWWNSEEFGKVKGNPFLLKSQAPCFSSQNPAAALCSVVCSDPGARCVPSWALGITFTVGWWMSDSVVTSASSGHHWQSQIALTDEFCILGELFPLWEWVLLVNLKKENTQLYWRWTVRIFFAFVQISAEVCGWNPNLFQGSGGFLMDSEADLLCEDKLELHFAKLHMTKIHCSFTAAFIINMPHFTLFWITPLRF